MKRVRGYHVLFGLTLLALAALGTWWTIFFLRSVDFEERAKRSELVHAAVVTALMLGHVQERPRPGSLAGPVSLEIVPASVARRGDLSAPVVPNHPDLVVRPAHSAVAAIDEKIARRRFMLIGEGIFLLALLIVLTFMLYRLVRQERRHMRRMEAFVASVTHEMKTPLAGIKSMLQTFAAGNVPEGEQARIYAMGLKEAERLEHMVENILISGRLRGGRFQVRNEALELKPLLENFLEHRRRYLVGRPQDICFEWEIDGIDTRVSADPDALRVILDNLTDNAFKYGGPSPRVTLRVRREHGRVRISIEDEGIGFEPEKARQLFVPFRRALDPQDSIQHGTGLGLAISHALARRMSGDLDAASDGPGRGSRFTLSLAEAG